MAEDNTLLRVKIGDLLEAKATSNKKGGANGPMIIVEAPTPSVCAEDHKLPKCVFAVSAEEWKKLGDLINSMKTADMGHQLSIFCSISYDFAAIYAHCRVVDTNPTESVLEFVEKIKNEDFLTELRDLFEDNL